MTALTQDSKRQLAEIFALAANEPEDDSEIEALSRLDALPSDEWQGYINQPIIVVNPAASGRQINESIETCLKHWKQERGLNNQRVRAAKYPEYLQVWDLREGWTGSTYDRARETTLTQIATSSKLPLTTVTNHYQSAFASIVGHPYSPELWAKVFGVIKLSRLFGDQLGPAASHRPLKGPTPKPWPDPALSNTVSRAPADEPPRLGASTAYRSVDLAIDIYALITQGLNDDEIVKRLELPETASSDIACMRERGNEA